MCRFIFIVKGCRVFEPSKTNFWNSNNFSRIDGFVVSKFLRESFSIFHTVGDELVSSTYATHRPDPSRWNSQQCWGSNLHGPFLKYPRYLSPGVRLQIPGVLYGIISRCLSNGSSTVTSSQSWFFKNGFSECQKLIFPKYECSRESSIPGECVRWTVQQYRVQ